MLANILSRCARRLLVHRQCLDVSLPRCFLPLLPLSLPLPLLLCTREPKSCDVTLTSLLAPISPLMTQRQFQDRPPHFTCVSFQHKLGGVRCSGSWTLPVSPSHSRQLPLFGLFAPQRSSLTASLHQDLPARVLATGEVHLNQSTCKRKPQYIIAGRQ